MIDVEEDRDKWLTKWRFSHWALLSTWHFEVAPSAHPIAFLFCTQRVDLAICVYIYIMNRIPSVGCVDVVH